MDPLEDDFCVNKHFVFSIEQLCGPALLLDGWTNRQYILYVSYSLFILKHNSVGVFFTVIFIELLSE